uniref:Uncharacterized protein n=1 Tax=Leersia perrieri TaxID=77586 RepID=A0A0D9X4W6_9ORYZ
MEQKEELSIKEKSFKKGEAMASSSSSSLFSHPPSLLRHVVDGFAGYLAGLCHSLQNLKPATPATAVPKQEAEVDEATNTAPALSSEEPVAVQTVRSRAMARPQGPVLREANGGIGGSHHNVGV